MPPEPQWQVMPPLRDCYDEARIAFHSYPEIVEAMSLYASAHWRSLALGEQEQTRLFKVEFHRRLPQERSLRTTARHWFRTGMITTAWRIELAIKSAETKEPATQVDETQAHLPGVE